MGEFYLTVGIPLVYLLGLYFLRKGGTIVFSEGMRAIGIMLAGIGVIMWGMSYLNLSNSFGVLPKRQKRVTRGLYKYLKHPMYWGISLTYSGIGVANQARAGLMYTWLVLIPILILRAKLETRKLNG